ncbi:MAG: hypothetical protein Fur007_03300 [Rhodoferax sp.]
MRMTAFATLPFPLQPRVTAPGGSDVRVLLALSGGSMAHFSLAPGRCSAAVRHRTVEELWFVVSGGAAMWRSQDGRAEVVELHPGTSLSIPLGTAFPFKTLGDAPFTAVAITLPPWPGPLEVVPVEGPWQATSHPRGAWPDWIAGARRQSSISPSTYSQRPWSHTKRLSSCWRTARP